MSSHLLHALIDSDSESSIVLYGTGIRTYVRVQPLPTVTLRTPGPISRSRQSHYVRF